MTVGTLFVNRDGNVISAFGGVAGFLGYGNGEIIGSKISAVFHIPDDSAAGQYKWLCELPASGTRIAAKHRTEGEMPMEVCAFRVDGSDSVGLSCAPVKVDQTSLRYSRKIVAMFTHDLRTPLNSILGFVQLLEMGTYGTIQAQSLTSLRIAQRNVLKVLKLVDELLDFERLDSGYSQLSFEEINLAVVVNQAIEATAHAASEKDIHIQASIGNASIFGEADQIFRVVMNLLDNAIKFSPLKSTISLRCEAVGQQVELSVGDCGPGISPEFHKAIFEPFFQLRPTKALDHKGVGLGLSVCKAIVELHGGRIGVVSQPECGSEFWIQLPTHSAGGKAPVVIPSHVPIPAPMPTGIAF